MNDAELAVIVGVTGHRNIVGEDKIEIKARVIESLKEIQSLCKGKGIGGEDIPVVMLNAFAQGADMLCAEAAFGLGMDVCAVLPCALEKYERSFDDDEDAAKLRGYLEKCTGVTVAPDMEKCRERFKAEVGMDDESYDYRQLGICIAERSDVLIALWDGKPPKVKYGCGTVEVIDFALNNNAAVSWIKCRRSGDGERADVRRSWIAGSRTHGVQFSAGSGEISKLILNRKNLF